MASAAVVRLRPHQHVKRRGAHEASRTRRHSPGSRYYQGSTQHPAGPLAQARGGCPLVEPERVGPGSAGPEGSPGTGAVGPAAAEPSGPAAAEPVGPMAPGASLAAYAVVRSGFSGIRSASTNP